MKLSELRSRQGLYKYHWLMWNELANGGLFRKFETSAIREVFNSTTLDERNEKLNKLMSFQCFLCQRHWKKDPPTLQHPNCGNRCPLWKLSGGFCCECGPYEKWCNSEEMFEREEYAAQIRDCVLPYLTDKTKKELGL